MKKTQFHNSEIYSGITKVSKEINQYYEDTEKPVMVLPVLNGGVFFYVDLVRILTFPNEMGVIATSKYKNGYPTTQEFQLKYFDADCSGKEVLVVDEICFTGETLKQTKEFLLESCGAKDVKTCVLINHIRDGRVHDPDWKALDYYGEEWLYGYGMDINGLYRNLGNIVYDKK